MAERGHATRLWRRDATALQALQAIGSLSVRDYRGTRRLALGDNLRLVSDLAEALQGADLVIIPLPSTSHAALAAEVAPLLAAGQVVFLPPGTFGSYVFAKAMADCGNHAEVAFAETGTLPYLVRKHGADQLVISAYATRLPTGVLPSRLSAHASACCAKPTPASSRSKMP
jgi:Glycerol-3-phosphate dehydrogenase